MKLEQVIYVLLRETNWQPTVLILIKCEKRAISWQDLGRCLILFPAGRYIASRKPTSLVLRYHLVISTSALQWRHNERDGVPNRRRIHCLLNCWLRRKSKKTSKLRVTGLCAGNLPGTGEFLHKRPVNYLTWKFFSFDDVIMCTWTTTQYK